MSNEIARGGLSARQFMGQAVTVFRTQTGQAYAVESYCPHLGAHFGYGGKVQGEYLQCPFHGFQFNGQGQCVQTGYNSPVPPRATLRTWPLCEQNGFILIYHHNHGTAPDWTVPPVEAEGWTRLIYKSFMLADHPQETTENSVDLGHFAYVHAYREARTLKEFEAEGAYLSTAYAVKRASKFLNLRIMEFDFAFETHIYGLGYSLVNVRVPKFHIVARLWVLPTSIDADQLILRLALQVKKWPGLWGALLNPIIARVILNGFVHDTKQDFPIWENKRYTDPPALAKGDGPIGKYRQWAKQFYR